MKSAAHSLSTAAPVTSFWDARKVRHIRGVTCSFYKRYGAFLYMDFKVKKVRVKESTGCTTLDDAVRVAEKRIQAMQEAGNGLADLKAFAVRQRAAVSTVREVLAALEGGDKVMTDNSLRTYKSALKRLALVAGADAEAARLDVVLSKANLERFYAQGQGRSEGQGVNWVNRLPCNGGLNTTIRNVRALFRPKMLELKFADLKLPPLEDLKRLPKLPAAKGGFKPWPAGVYERMDVAAADLKETDYELWLVNVCLRFLGLRACELLAARREWISTSEDGRAWLNVQDHHAEDAEEDEVASFELVKHGAARKLELNEVLKAALLPRTGWLIAPELATSDSLETCEDARHALIYRRHSEWLRQFIPDRRKSNHELRMYAGSLVAKQHGLEAACYFLGHTSLVTTQAFYWAWLKESPMLDGKALAGAHALA
jgi:integrase